MPVDIYVNILIEVLTSIFNNFFGVADMHELTIEECTVVSGGRDPDTIVKYPNAMLEWACNVFAEYRTSGVYFDLGDYDDWFRKHQNELYEEWQRTNG